MDRSRIIALAVVAALVGGGWYANHEGYLDGAKASYSEWVAAAAADKASRDASGRKPTPWEMTKDGIVYLSPGH